MYHLYHITSSKLSAYFQSTLTAEYQLFALYVHNDHINHVLEKWKSKHVCVQFKHLKNVCDKTPARDTYSMLLPLFSFRSLMCLEHV